MKIETLADLSAAPGFAVQPDHRGTFDELVSLDGVTCTVHLEMMSDNSLWMAFYVPGQEQRQVVWVSARGTLTVMCEND